MSSPVTPEAPGRLDFIREIITADNASGRHGGRVATRFPPEPNGYLHIGHAKSICLNFGIARDFGGICNLRFDDTNPVTEDVEYVESIQEDVRWLGFSWDDRLFYASDYFEQLYECAETLIRDGKAYVDSLDGRRDPRVPRHADGAGPRTARTATARSTRTSTCSAHARGRVRRTARACCARRSTWRRRTSTCATRCSTASGARIITAPATRGASIRCTTTRIRSRTRSSASRTRSARSNSRTTGRSTTG